MNSNVEMYRLQVVNSQILKVLVSLEFLDLSQAN